jgi:hypothetical protein
VSSLGDVPRVGRLSGNSATERTFWEQVYDPAVGGLRLHRAGQFWDAVATAYRSGARGEGRCIAIIDSGFDATLPALQRRIHPGSRVRADTVTSADRHGTRVALLVRAVAPDAELLLLDVGTGHQLTDTNVAHAIETARSLNVDVINLSLEFESDAEPTGFSWNDPSISGSAPPVEAFLAQVDAWIAHAEPYRDARCRSRCASCASLANVPQETLVVAASGNSFAATCPACVGKVVGAGFHTTRLVEREGVVYRTSELPQTQTRQLRPEFLVEEPPGFLGTSFAAPLLSGFASLVPAPAEIAKLAWVPIAMTPVLVLANTHAVTPARDIPEVAPRILHQGLLRIAEAVPVAHQHWREAMVTRSCAVCALVMVAWYDAFTSLLTASGVPERAAPIARIAAVLAPDAATVQSNLGLACRALAEKTLDASRRRELLMESANAYRRAIARAPDVSLYAAGSAEVTAALRAVSSGS